MSSSSEGFQCYACGNEDSSSFMHSCIGCSMPYCNRCMSNLKYCESCANDTSSKGYTEGVLRTGCKNCGPTPTTPVYYKCSICFKRYCSMCMHDLLGCKKCYDNLSD